jgi:hypothetical protein
VRLYSAISWGYWGYNGLWPTPELARREVTSAKTLGLNTLHFHRNVGKPEVFTAMDEMGLMRVMEPGGGRHAIGRDLKPGESLSAADAFSREFMFEKCQAMARAFRSHPSLVQYTLQNEIGANLANPDVQAVLKAIHDIDPSRAVILNDGFVKRGAAQAMYLPYSDHYYRSDVEEWGGWWVEHQGAGDQWYDKFYKGKDDYIHRQTGKPFIVEFGEMQGCAVADNHVKMVADILAHGGKSYDLEDHKVGGRERPTLSGSLGLPEGVPDQREPVPVGRPQGLRVLAQLPGEHPAGRDRRCRLRLRLGEHGDREPLGHRRQPALLQGRSDPDEPEPAAGDGDRQAAGPGLCGRRERRAGPLSVQRHRQGRVRRGGREPGRPGRAARR